MKNIYDVLILETEIERIASENDGEIPEELFRELVEMQTRVPEQLDNLVKYIRNLELGIETCKAEEQRIKAMRDKAENRIKSIKKYLTPYVIKKGKVEAGTFKLSTRKSEYVDLVNDFNVEKYMKEKVTVSPDKAKIKEDLKNGVDIPGAKISSNKSLQIK